MLMYPDPFKSWFDFGSCLLIFILFAQFWLSGTGQMWEFRAFSGELREVIAWEAYSIEFCLVWRLLYDSRWGQCHCWCLVPIGHFWLTSKVTLVYFKAIVEYLISANEITCFIVMSPVLILHWEMETSFHILNERKKMFLWYFCPLAVTWFHLKTFIIVSRVKRMPKTHINV